MANKRLSHLYEIISSADFDAIAFNPGPTLTYLTGLQFHLMERPTVLILQPGKEPALILPELETGKLSDSSIPVNAFTFGDNPAEWPDTFKKALESLGLNEAKIAVEPTRMRFLELDYLKKAAPGAQFVSGAEALSKLRIRKDADELTLMRKAIQIAQDALSATLDQFKIGMTEREIAEELTIQMLRLGSDPELPFAPIVAAGPNSANPHAAPSERKVQAGDLLLFDWGAYYRGYCSDLTRTFAVGKVDPELKKIYEIVKEANLAGRNAGKPDLVAGIVDQAARRVIEAAGYGKFFFHRTGHGLGMEGHEEPYMFGENSLLLAQGMTYTVEPGIYLEGKGGVRIEDNIAVSADGSETLSSFSREFTVIG